MRDKFRTGPKYGDKQFLLQEIGVGFECLHEFGQYNISDMKTTF